MEVAAQDTHKQRPAIAMPAWPTEELPAPVVSETEPILSAAKRARTVPARQVAVGQTGRSEDLSPVTRRQILA
jgi:hypothetical protein